MLRVATLLAIAISAYLAVAEPDPDCHGAGSGGNGLKEVPSGAQILILEPPAHRSDNLNRQDETDIVKMLNPKKCLKNEVYSVCKSDCQRYCDLETATVRLPNNCSGKCVAGCTCKKGYVRPPLDATFKECISFATCKGMIDASQPEQE